MVTLLQNVRDLFVWSDEAVVHTCPSADTQPAHYSVQHHWHSCPEAAVHVENKELLFRLCT